MHESREKEVAKLIREGMDPTKAQDLVDAQIPEDPESGSDEEEQEEEPESPGDVDFGPDVSPRGTSESGAPKRTRDEVEPEPEPAKTSVHSIYKKPMAKKKKKPDRNARRPPPQALSSS